MRKTLPLVVVALTIACCFQLRAQSTLISSTINNGGFESGATGWTLVNGAQTNKWFIGNTAVCNGTNAAYIGTAAGNNNYNVNSNSIVHLYKDIAFPAGEPCITLTFNYAGQGESTFDRMRVYVVPTSTTPVAGTAVAGGNQVGAANYGLQSSCTNASITLSSAFAGTTQRIIFSWRNDGSLGTNPAIRLDDVTIVTSGGPSNDEPCTATPITPSLTCSYTTYTTACATGSVGPPAPGCANYITNDVWFSLTVPASGTLTFDSQTGVILDGGMAVYSGTCGSLTLLGCDDDASTNGAMPMLTLNSLTPGATLWIRFWEYGGDNDGTFGLCVTDPCPGGAPANDLCANSISLSLGITTTGNNSCSGSAGEPVAPGGWTGGTINSVWYDVVCPASGNLSIRTGLGTLVNTQIEVFSGTCGALTSIGNNNDITLCGNTQQWSEVVLTGLTPGATYYIRVDGANSLTGDFSITAINGSGAWPLVFGQDCSVGLPVCSSLSTIGNPGFIGSGNYCDFPGGAGCPAGSCIIVGERNAVWYTFTVNAAGTLSFTLTPNTPVDYDWQLFDVTGNASACAQIAAGTLLPIRCSYSGATTPTGMGAPGTEPCDGTGGTLDAWSSTLAVTGTEQYLLMVSNFSTATFVGYTLNWNASPINYSGSATLTWTGATNTDWNTSSNWGGCGIPDCTKDVVIFAGPTNQPIVPTGTTVNCRNITIQPSASVTLNGTATLNVCGDFVNNGTFTAATASTVAFIGTGTQNVNGNNSGTNSFGNFRVTKTSGSTVLNQQTDIKGTLTISNGTSILNMNNQYVTIGGNFSNFNGGTTITNTTTNTIEFNGSSAQTYSQGTSTLTLNNVLMTHTSTGLTLSTNMVLGTAGTLTLTTGKIITGANEVQVMNTATGACTAGNTSSFVQGNLRRYLNGAATSYNFPVGHATPGYELANITFTTATTIPQLLARFDTWPTVPVGPAASECPTNTYNVLNALNHGYWTITASANPTSGNYNVSLYNNGYSNSAGAAGWTVMKAATGAGPWALNGTCVGTSTANLTQRTGLNGFSAFGTAQSVLPLPVELLFFKGDAEADYNHLSWSTASEINNDYFTLERSTDGINFVELGRIDGAGNSIQTRNYSFNDMLPVDGINYYRLKQTDLNGQFTYSNIVSLEFHLGHMSVTNVRPNPTSGMVDFDFNTPEETEIRYIITDVTGRIVVDEVKTVKPGKNTLATTIDQQGAGVYSLKVIEEKHGFISVTRIVKY